MSAAREIRSGRPSRVLVLYAGLAIEVFTAIMLALLIVILALMLDPSI